MKIALISSNGDIGHRFIQNGITKLFDEHITINSPRINVQYLVIDKHAPLYSENYFQESTAKILQSDLIIIAGGPILWPFVERADWADWLSFTFKEAYKNDIPICAISVGSCYGYRSETEVMEIRKEELNFIEKLLCYCSLVTTRDKLAQEILDKIGIKNTLLPCIAYYSMYPPQNNYRGSKIAFNFMRGGGHHDYLNSISSNQWYKLAKKLILSLSRTTNVEFLCHSISEFELAPCISAGIQSNLIINKQDFLRAIVDVNIGVCNRIHASIAMAGLGVPSLTIGTDSRILSLEEFGQPTLKLPINNYKTLMNAVDTLIENRISYSNILRTKLPEVTTTYKKMISQFITYNYGDV
jgi:polysaccharide pyruvyl transferase WcaK-like protein